MVFLIDSILPMQPQDLYEYLNKLDIKYELFEHEPHSTVSQAKKNRVNMEGFHLKNLFLKDKKKNFLIVFQEDLEIDLKALPEKLGSYRLSFGSPDRLFKKLGVLPGSVTPLSLINNKERDVSLFIDERIKNEVKIFCHPLINDKTIALSYVGLEKFFESLKVKVNFLHFV